MIRTVFFKKTLVLFFVLGASLGLLKAVDEDMTAVTAEVSDVIASTDEQAEKISAVVQDGDLENYESTILDDEQQKVSATGDITFESSVVSDDSDFPSAEETFEATREEVSATSRNKKSDDDDDTDEEKIIDEDDENISSISDSDHDLTLDFDGELEEF